VWRLRRLHDCSEGNSANSLVAAEIARNCSVSQKMFMARDHEPLIQRIVFSAYFDNVCVLLIVANSILLGYRANMMAVNTWKDPDAPRALTNAQTFFSACFAIELVARVAASRSDFFRGPDVSWNVFDTVLVAVSVLEAFLRAVSGTGVGSMSFLRVLRVLRVVRVVRIIRVFRFFYELRMMVAAVMNCFRSLVWVIVLLLVTLYVFAVLFLQIATDYRAEAHGGDRIASTLEEHFGSISKGMYSLFLTITGGISWGEVADPLIMADWVYGVFFMLFICFMIFAVLNIITGVFVEGAIDRAQAEKDAQIQENINQERGIEEDLAILFDENDLDHTGFIDYNEFKKMFADEKMKAQFRGMGLKTNTPWDLFRMLDTDKSYKVHKDEFIKGCLHLKDNASKLDMAILMTEFRRAATHWTKLSRLVSHELEHARGEPQSPTTARRSRTERAGHDGSESPPSPASPAPRPRNQARVSGKHTSLDHPFALS